MLDSLSSRQFDRLIWWGERLCRDNDYDWGQRDAELYYLLKLMKNNKVNGEKK